MSSPRLRTAVLRGPADKIPAWNVAKPPHSRSAEGLRRTPRRGEPPHPAHPRIPTTCREEPWRPAPQVRADLLAQQRVSSWEDTSVSLGATLAPGESGPSGNLRTGGYSSPLMVIPKNIIIGRRRVIKVHPNALKHGLSANEVRFAWENYLIGAVRVPGELEVRVGVDSVGRQVEMVGSLLSGGEWLVYHAMTPPTKKVLNEINYLIRRN